MRANRFRVETQPGPTTTERELAYVLGEIRRRRNVIASVPLTGQDRAALCAEVEALEARRTSVENELRDRELASEPGR
jgi:hypothetical protein